MAFNGIQPSSGPFSMSVGSPSMRIRLRWPDGSDHGAIWIQANPTGPGTVQTGDFTKKRIINPDGQSFRVEYFCTVSATDDAGSGFGVVLFNLDGGGNN